MAAGMDGYEQPCSRYCARSAKRGESDDALFSQRGGCSSCSTPRVQAWMFERSLGQTLPLSTVVEVSFKAGRTGFYRNTRQIDLRPGDPVMVEADRGIDLGKVYLMGDLVRTRLRSVARDEGSYYPDLLRVATSDDLAVWQDVQASERAAIAICRDYIEELRIEMKLVDVEWQFDRNKLTFYFTADRRVDFRALVRKLARTFRTRVELRQIGIRDQAARTGGIGVCGRELCCSIWLHEFDSVNTSSAKCQNLPMNPQRLSGQCGRLKCCLNYELEHYAEALKPFPRIDSEVTTERGTAIVRKLDIFKKRIWVRYPDGTWEDLSLADLEQNETGTT